MHGLVVGLRALHVGERADGAAQLLLELELRDRDLARSLIDLELGERLVADPVRFDANAVALQLANLVPVDGGVVDPVRPKILLVRQRPRVADVGDGNELHRGVAARLEHRGRIEEIVAIAVVERDEHGARRERSAIDVVRDHRVEIDDRVAELTQLRHLLREPRDGHRHPVVRKVVDLVVHEDAQRALVAVDGADAVRRLADRAIDGVLQ